MLEPALINFWSIVVDAIIEVVYYGRETAFILLGYTNLSRIQCINHFLGYLERFGSFLRVVLLCCLGPILTISLSITKELKCIKLLFILLLDGLLWLLALVRFSLLTFAFVTLITATFIDIRASLSNLHHELSSSLFRYLTKHFHYLNYFLFLILRPGSRCAKETHRIVAVFFNFSLRLSGFEPWILAMSIGNLFSEESCLLIA